MSDPILSEVAQDVRSVNEQMERARTLISALREAGEDTTELQSTLRGLELRKNKWETMLKNRGYTV